MPVQTPQLEEPIFQPQQMQPPPMATGQPAQMLPPQAGFVSKAGAGAFIANNVLQGWLKGREIKAQREMQKAQTQLQGADYVYKIAQDHYNEMLRNGADPKSKEAQQAYNAATTAWGNKVNVMGQYAVPAEPAKKSAKQKVEGGFGQLFGKSGITPHLIAQASLQMLQSSPPPGLGLTLQDKQTIAQTTAAQQGLDLTKLNIEEANERIKMSKLEDTQKTQAIQDLDRFKTDAAAPDKMSPTERLWFEGQQKMDQALLARTDPVRAATNDALQIYLKAGPLSPAQTSLLQSQNLMPGPHLMITHEGNAEMLTVTDPSTGKVIGTPTRVGWTESQASIAVASARQLHQLFVEEAIKAGMTPAQAEQAALLQQSNNPGLMASYLGDNPATQAMNQQAASKALFTAWNNVALKDGKLVFGDPTSTGEERKAGQAAMTNFTTGDPRGGGHFMMFRNQLADPTGSTGWFTKTPTYAGGFTQQQVADMQAGLYDQVRTAMAEQNPTWTPPQLDAALPEWVRNPAGKPQAAQSGGTAGQAMTPPPPGGQYSFGENLTEIFGPTAFGVGIPTINRLLSAPPGQAEAKPGADGNYGVKTPASKLYEIDTDSHGWKKVWLTPEQLDAVKQSKPAGIRAAGEHPI